MKIKNKNIVKSYEKLLLLEINLQQKLFWYISTIINKYFVQNHESENSTENRCLFFLVNLKKLLLNIEKRI